MRCCLGGGLGSVGLMVGLNDLGGPFQPKQHCDAVIPSREQWLLGHTPVFSSRQPRGAPSANQTARAVPEDGP